METLFRFVQIRTTASDEIEAINISQDTGLQNELLTTDRVKQKAAARKFITTKKFISNVAQLPIGKAIAKFTKEINLLENLGDPSPADIHTKIKESFGEPTDVLIGKTNYKNAVRDLRDSILAIKYLPEAHSYPIHKLVSALRDLEVIKEAATNSSFPKRGDIFKKFRHRSIALPFAVGGTSILKTNKPDLSDIRSKAEEKRKEFEGKLKQYGKLSDAIKELGNITPDKVVTTRTQASKSSLLPSGLRPWSLFANLVGFKGGVSNTPESARAVVTIENAKGALSSAVTGQSTRTTHAGRSAFTPDDALQHGLRLTPAGINSLSTATKAALSEQKVSLKLHTVDLATASLQKAQKALGRQLSSLAPKKRKISLGRRGKGRVIANKVNFTSFQKINTGIQPFPTQWFFSSSATVPTSHGNVTPAGLADLLVVKQQLKGYVSTDVAHIENILKGETKSREHRRREETEMYTFTETETTTSSERELESTDRFEMSRESSKKIEEKASIKGSLSVSGKYGPVVEVSASVEASAERAREEASKSASSFSKEITQSSSESISERVLERESLKITKEVEETNKHGLDNTGGGGHISGVYQWVEKVYEAQMFNYGLRTIYDFMVPEPGAYLIHALQEAHSASMEIEKPVEFTLEADEIEEDEIQFWIQEYSATDIMPSPEIYTTESFDYSIGGGDDKTDYNHSGQIQIPDGYRAISATMAAVKNIWDDNHTIDVAVGSRTHRFNEGDSWLWSTSLTGERGSVPFAINTFHISDVAIAGEIKCQRTDRAMEEWRYDTHTKLTQAYQARMSEYEEKLAELELQAGVAIEGQNPDINLSLIKDEMKKASISILSEQHFDLFGAIETDSDGRPQIDISENEAEGPYVRFFEQAFEWEQMSWVTYPYFWGRKDTWEDRLGLEDPDPVFNDFLKAGYCRLVVPVREGFEGAVDHFMTFGEPWMGGPLPTVSSEHYLPIADELAELSGRPKNEVEDGDPWPVYVPTNLVKLRDDDALPEWEKDANGEWVEK